VEVLRVLFGEVLIAVVVVVQGTLAAHQPLLQLCKLVLELHDAHVLVRGERVLEVVVHCGLT